MGRRRQRDRAEVRLSSRPRGTVDQRSQGHAFFANADNYLIDLKTVVILDVEATRAIRQAEVGAARTMIERTVDRFGLKPERLPADSANCSAHSLDWLVKTKGIAPHISVLDKSWRDDATFSRSDFQFDEARISTFLRQRRR